MPKQLHRDLTMGKKAFFIGMCLSVDKAQVLSFQTGCLMQHKMENKKVLLHGTVLRYSSTPVNFRLLLIKIFRLCWGI